MAASHCFAAGGVQLPQETTVSNQFTKLFASDALISSPLPEQKPFANGMAGNRSLHLVLKRQSTQP